MQNYPFSFRTTRPPRDMSNLSTNRELEILQKSYTETTLQHKLHHHVRRCIFLNPLLDVVHAYPWDRAKYENLPGSPSMIS